MTTLEIILNPFDKSESLIRHLQPSVYITGRKRKFYDVGRVMVVQSLKLLVCFVGP